MSLKVKILMVFNIVLGIFGLCGSLFVETWHEYNVIFNIIMSSMLIIAGVGILSKLKVFKKIVLLTLIFSRFVCGLGAVLNGVLTFVAYFMEQYKKFVPVFLPMLIISVLLSIYFWVQLRILEKEQMVEGI